MYKRQVNGDYYANVTQKGKQNIDTVKERVNSHGTSVQMAQQKYTHLCWGREGWGVWVGINQVVQREVCITYLQTSAKHTKL